MKKTVAFISHHKSFGRLQPDVKALRELGFGIVVLTNSIHDRPFFINQEEFLKVDLADVNKIAKILSSLNVIFVATPTDHLLITVVKVCQLLKIEPPCDLPTAELFVDKHKNIEHAIAHGLQEHVPDCITVKNTDDLCKLEKKQHPIFIKPTIGSGMRGVFESDQIDEYLFEYKGIKNGQELFSILNKHHLMDKFVTYCTDGMPTKYYYPTRPRALIQDFYHTNKSYTFQYSVLNGKWYYNTIGQLFNCVQPSDRTPGEKINALQDPRSRLTDGSQLCSEEVGYYHLREVPDHIFLFFKKCVEYMKSNFKVNNMAVVLAIHETIDGKFIMTDLNPRVGGQWLINHRFSQPDFYLKFWDAVLNKSQPEKFEHIGPLGCANTVFLDPGVIEQCTIPPDSPTRIITDRHRLESGQTIPALQSFNSRDWGVKIYTCGNDLDQQIQAVLSFTAEVRNTIRYSSLTT
jgi:hypothetical protein